MMSAESLKWQSTSAADGGAVTAAATVPASRSASPPARQRERLAFHTEGQRNAEGFRQRSLPCQRRHVGTASASARYHAVRQGDVREQCGFRRCHHRFRHRQHRRGKSRPRNPFATAFAGITAIVARFDISIPRERRLKVRCAIDDRGDGRSTPPRADLAGAERSTTPTNKLKNIGERMLLALISTPTSQPKQPIKNRVLQQVGTRSQLSSFQLPRF